MKFEVELLKDTIDKLNNIRKDLSNRYVPFPDRRIDKTELLSWDTVFNLMISIKDN